VRTECWSIERAWLVVLAGWCEVDVVSTMSDGSMRVNGWAANERRRDVTMGGMPAAGGKGL